MSLKSKSVLFSRKKNRDLGSYPQVEPTSEPTPSRANLPPKTAAPPALNSHPNHSFRGADAINADGAKHIENLRKKTGDGIRDDVKNEIRSISPNVAGFLTSGKKDGRPGKGEHFLENDMQKLHNDFLEKWKHEMLFPSIQQWLELHIVGYVENLLSKRTEAIIKKYEEAITAIGERHKQEIIDLERRHKEVLINVVKKTWAEYEKKMTDIQLMRQIHFHFASSAQHEPWSEGIEEIVPEIKDNVPKVYEPKLDLEESEHQNHKHHNHNRRHKNVHDTAPAENHDHHEIRSE